IPGLQRPPESRHRHDRTLQGPRSPRAAFRLSASLSSRAGARRRLAAAAVADRAGALVLLRFGTDRAVQHVSIRWQFPAVDAFSVVPDVRPARWRSLPAERAVWRHAGAAARLARRYAALRAH